MEIFDSIIKSGAVGPFGMFVIFLLYLYDRRKPKQPTLDGLGPMIQAAVESISIKYCRAQVDKEQVEVKRRADEHSDEIKALERDNKESMEKIEERVRKTEKKIVGIEKGMEYLKESIGEIKKEIKDGNDTVMEYIRTIGGSK